MIIVTAGHVDHGKTALLEALTGTHTAHLPEEKKRGLTIDLGYAYLPIGQDILGFIDVPGHQKFLSNMLAGLGGISHALLVVSAEEGVKPQTEEHLAILTLLKFDRIIVVLSKADRVQPGQISALIAELKQRYAVLETADFFATSAHTGEGIEALKQHLIQLNQQSRQIHKPFRYAIDRVFNVKGAGLVVTGTAVAGKVAIGDELYLSNGQKVRVKNIHAQNQAASEGLAGQRLALNLANVEKAQIARGDWITQLAPEFASERLTVRLTAAQPLKESSVVHCYHFASHVTAKLNLLDRAQCTAGETALAELILDTPLHIALDDKFILRSGDDSQTIAGASVIEIGSPKRHKRSEARLTYLADLAAAHYPARIEVCLAHKAVNLAQLLWAEQIFLADLESLAQARDYYLNANYLFNHGFKQQLQQQIVAQLEAYHQQHSDQLGVTKARLHRIAALEQPELLVYNLIDELIGTQTLAQTRGWVHTPTHRIEFTPNELQRWAEVRPLFERTNQALWVRDIASELSVDETEMRNLLYKAGKLGYLVPIVKDRFLLHEQISEFARLIKDFIQQHGEISVNQLRDEIQYGRKLTVQLIEYFDRSGFLRRKGNVHLLRDKETY